jgi:hypothetical protein
MFLTPEFRSPFGRGAQLLVTVQLHAGDSRLTRDIRVSVV